VKSPKLDYRRLADHLTDKGLVDRETIQHVVQQCTATGSLLPEILVSEGLVSDWELSRVCTELFHIPYLPVECYPPSAGAREGLDIEYLRQYGLVPLDRFGNLVTVSMPGIVPSEVIDGLSADGELRIIPIIGSVAGNRRWIEQNLPSTMSATLEAFSAALPEEETSWSDLFDDADQAVNFDLMQDPGENAA